MRTGALAALLGGRPLPSLVREVAPKRSIMGERQGDVGSPVRRGPLRVAVDERLRSAAVRRAAIAGFRRVEFRGKHRLAGMLGLEPGSRVLPDHVRWIDCVDSIRCAATDPSDQMLHELYVHRHYQNDVLVALAQLLSPGDVFWDVGANHGFMSLWVSRVFNGTVRTIAFEPNPEVLPSLRWNVEANAAAVEVEPVALSDVPGRARLFSTAGQSWNATLSEDFAGHATGDDAVEVPMTTIDEAVTSLPLPSVLKIDVEGAEAKVLAGGRQTLAGLRPPIVAEYNAVSLSDAGLSGEEYLDMFRELGYTPHVMDRPWVGWHRWEALHPVASAAELRPLCNLILLAA